MADERIFSIKINGVEQSYKEVTKLADALGKIQDVSVKVNVEAEVSKIEGMNSIMKELSSLLQSGTGILKAFGVESEVLNETMNSLGKTMALVNSLQEISNKLSAANAAAQSAQAGQTSNLAGSIGKATTAQKALNAVAKANPYIALASAIVELYQVYDKLLTSVENVFQAQKTYTSSVDGTVFASQEAMKAHDDHAAKIRDLELEYKKLSGEISEYDAGVETILNKRNDTIKEANDKVLEAEQEAVNKGIKFTDYMLLASGFGIYRFYKKYQESKEAEKIAAQEAENAKMITDRATEVAEAETKAHKERLAQEVNAIEEKLRADLMSGKEQELAYLKIAHQKELEEAEKKGVSSVLIAAKYAKQIQEIEDKYVKQYSGGFNKIKEELEKEQIKAIENAEEREIASIQSNFKRRLKEIKGNSKEAKALRVLLESNTQKEIEKIKEKTQSDYRKKALQDDLALINAKLAAEKDGSEESHKLTVDKLYKEREIALQNADLSAKEREAIEIKFNDDLSKLGENRAKHLYDIESNIATASINARLAAVKAGSQEETDLRLQLLEIQAKAELENIENTIGNEELKAAKIKEINEKLRKDKNELSSSGELSSLSKYTEKQTLELTQQLERQEITQKEFEQKKKDLSFKALEEELAIRKKYGLDTTQVETKLSNTRIEQAKEEKDKVSKYFQELHDNMKKVVDQMMTGVNAIFEGANAIMQSQLDDAKEKFEEISEKYDEVAEKKEESDSKIQDLEEKAKNARGGLLLVYKQQIADEMAANQQLANQEKDLAKQKEKQEKEVAKKEKQMKKAQIMSDIVSGLSSTALAVVNALAMKPFPLGVVMAGIAGAMGAIQVGVMTKQLSKLEDGGLLKGKRHAEGGMRVEGTDIEVEGGEYVINRESTDKNLGLIKYINSQRRQLSPGDIDTFFTKPNNGFEPSFKRMFETGGQLPAISNPVSIDNETLVEAIQSIKIEPKVSVTDINTVQDQMVSVNHWTGM